MIRAIIVFTAISLLMVPFSRLSSQTSLHRTCSTMDIHNEKMKDEVYRASFEAKMQRSAYGQSQGRELCPSPVILPMAVHYSGIPSPSDDDKACLQALALNQIQILNDDFNGTNADITNWDTYSDNYPGVSNGETCVTFCLATQNHPSGYNLSNGDYAITYNQVTGDFNSDWSGYINVWVKNIGALGYSPLGGNGNGDGVAVDIEAFGSGSGCPAVNVVPDAPYHLGRTLTHELGHYLFLRHIWGGGGCSSDDGIADTPNASSSNFGCPSPTSSSCGSIDMHMNYMDYTNDPCMYMFSAGQSTVMENYVDTDLDIVSDNADICNIMLPLEFVRFEGQEFNNEIELTWNTASEIDNEGFQIMRSQNNGLTFSKIGWVSANENYEYSYSDQNITRGHNYYYKLIQLDRDGNENHSPIISIAVENINIEFECYPNPLKDGLYIKSNRDLKESKMVVVNNVGHQFHVRPENNYIALSEFPPGVYFLMIYDQQNIVYKTKFVKQ